jgi:hypothetical protein
MVQGAFQFPAPRRVHLYVSTFKNTLHALPHIQAARAFHSMPVFGLFRVWRIVQLHAVPAPKSLYQPRALHCVAERLNGLGKVTEIRNLRDVLENLTCGAVAV